MRETDRLPRRGPHGARHRGRVRLCGAQGRAGRLQAARRRRRSRSFATTRWAKSRNVLAHCWRSFGLFDRGRGRSACDARVGRSGSERASRAVVRRHHLRRRAGSARPQARGAGARIASLPGRSRSSPRPHRPSWSTIFQARSNIPSASSTRTGSIRRSWCRWSRSRPASTPIPAVTARVKALLESVGKVPVVCAARPGYIVPRIQALAMNEAARMVEEGVASAEDIDKAIKYGFGIRFAVLGMLEFIDWGGGDILYYASRYLTGALGNERYAAPDIVERNMARRPHRPARRRGLSQLRRARRGGVSARAAEGVRRVARAFRAEPAAGA